MLFSVPEVSTYARSLISSSGASIWTDGLIFDRAYEAQGISCVFLAGDKISSNPSWPKLILSEDSPIQPEIFSGEYKGAATTSALHVTSAVALPFSLK